MIPNLLTKYFDMSKHELLAHSARHGCRVQTYQEHIGNVVRGVFARARRILKYYLPKKGKPTRRDLLAILGDASSFHDFGKLDDGFQETLRKNRYSPTHIRHEDAGVVILAKYGAMEAAGLVSAHHRGLVKYGFEEDKEQMSLNPSKKLSLEPFRIQEHPYTLEATKQGLEAYKIRHESVFKPRCTEIEDGLSKCSGFMRRVLLSCLVDSDHHDTARHYQKESELVLTAPRWRERLDSLDRYVAELKKEVPDLSGEASQLRQEIRDELYEACRNADTSQPLRSCDAVVGSGKTTAVMAYLLKVAAERKLRHIFVVLPYTNIIRQSVEVYRKALCLEGENPEDVIAEHHHQVVFKGLDNRHLTTLWCAPIIVTTAVQFFETLGSNQTGMLRKLHELPGSAVFLDEAHAALPSELWPICWDWLVEWINQWGGHLVLGSGSLAEFWTTEEFRSISIGGAKKPQPPTNVQPLAEKLREKTRHAEYLRIRFDSLKQAISGNELMDRIEESQGPRLVIVNTVQSAATLAQMLAERDKQLVLHLSTALAPIHRSIIIERIKELLRYRKDWTLVATSMVEAGLDFSFATGFRQRCSAASLIQTGGRVNRGAKMDINGLALDFDFSDLETFPDNPYIKASKQALAELFEAGFISPKTPADLGKICLEAMKMEFKPGKQGKAVEIVRMEKEMDYPSVAEFCRVIQNDTRIVVVDRDLVFRLGNYERISRTELVQRSVQMYPYKIEKLGISRIFNDSNELFALPESWNYDPDCYGYMAECLKMQSASISNGYFI
jgi:CRISPR-associated endonuclease/helicase Cas3